MNWCVSKIIFISSVRTITFSCFYHPGQVLLKSMLKPLVMYPSLSVTVSEQQEAGIVLALQGSEESREQRSTPSRVYSKLLMVLKALHTHLLGRVQTGRDQGFSDQTFQGEQDTYLVFFVVFFRCVHR